MHPILARLDEKLPHTGDLAHDADAFLRAHQRPLTANHSRAVAEQARDVAALNSSPFWHTIISWIGRLIEGAQWIGVY